MIIRRVTRHMEMGVSAVIAVVIWKEAIEEYHMNKKINTFEFEGFTQSEQLNNRDSRNLKGNNDHISPK